jgi:hypothetical protein
MTKKTPDGFAAGGVEDWEPVLSCLKVGKSFLAC